MGRRNKEFITHIRGIVSNLKDTLQSKRDRIENDQHEFFHLDYITCLSSIESIIDNPKPKVVLASLPGLETSVSQVFLKRWCEKKQNLLLFVTPPPPGTLAHSIFSNPNQKKYYFIVWCHSP